MGGLKLRIRNPSQLNPSNHLCFWMSRIPPLLVSKSLRTVVSAKLLDQLLGTSGDLSWEVYCVNSLEDDVVGLHRVGACEGRGAREQLKHQNSERPVVCGDIVALVEYHFWGDILGSPAECPSLSTHRQFLGKTKVYKLYIATCIQKQVLWLEVSVDDASAVQVVECLNNATCVEPSCLIVKVTLVPEDGPELSTKAG